jgi:Mrp family chromosome partitioning ATPase
MLVDRAMQVRSVAGDLDVGLVDQPPVAGGVAARSSRVEYRSMS